MILRINRTRLSKWEPSNHKMFIGEYRGWKYEVIKDRKVLNIYHIEAYLIKELPLIMTYFANSESEALRYFMKSVDEVKQSNH